MATDFIKLTISSAAWANSTAYVVGQYVSESGYYFRCIAAHTSATATSKPLTGTAWTTYWYQTTATKTLRLAKDGERCLYKSYEVADNTQQLDLPIYEQSDFSGGWGHGNQRNSNTFGSGSSIDTSQKNQVFLGPLASATLQHSGAAVGTIIDYEYCPYYSALYAITANDVWKWSVANSHWDNVATLAGDALTDIHAVGSYIYVARGTGTAYSYSADGASFSTSTVTNHHASGFITCPPASGTTDIHWQFLIPNQIRSRAVGEGEWSGPDPIYISGTDSNIVKLILHQNKLLIGKTDGLYHYDTDGRTYSMLPELKFITSPYNFAHVCSFKGATYFSQESRIGELTAGNKYSNIGPFQDLEDMTNKGYCTGLAADRDFIYACMSDGFIYKGWQNLVDDEWVWAWTPWNNTANCAGPMCVTDLSGDTKKLWYRVGTSPYYSILSDNPTNDSNYKFASSGYIETGWIDLGHRDWDKILDAVVAECRGTMDANKTVLISYYSDEGSKVDIGTYSATTAGFKKYVATAPVAGKKFKFRIALASNAAASTPIVKYFAVYGSVRPPNKRIFDFSVLAEQGQSTITDTLRDFLVDCRNSTSLVTLTDRFNASHSVRVLPGSPKEDELVNPEGKQVNIIMAVKCEKVDWA